MIMDSENTTTKQWLEYNSSTRATPTGWTYNSVEQFVLLNGRPFQKATAPTKLKLGGMGRCFKNSVTLAKTHGLIYCEGYARRGPTSFAFLHGWCINEDGVVYDPTWRDGWDYVGVAIDLDFAIQRRKQSGWESVLDSPPEFPVICGSARDWRYLGAVGDGAEENNLEHGSVIQSALWTSYPKKSVG